MNDWVNDPEARAWVESFIDNVLPKMRKSAAVVSIVPDEAGIADVKIALELGMSIMLDKLIIVAVEPGSRVPERLVRVADRIIEIPTDPADTSRMIRAAIDELLPEEGSP